MPFAASEELVELLRLLRVGRDSGGVVHDHPAAGIAQPGHGPDDLADLDQRRPVPGRLEPELFLEGRHRRLGARDDIDAGHGVHQGQIRVPVPREGPGQQFDDSGQVEVLAHRPQEHVPDVPVDHQLRVDRQGRADLT
jgi:hypothetical protein